MEARWWTVDEVKIIDYAGPERPRSGKLITLLAILPLVFAIVQIPWMFTVGMFAWYTYGDPGVPKAAGNTLAVVAALPVAIGFPVGIFVWTRRPRGWRKFCALVGTAGCAGFILIGVWGLMR